jgi:hypothetical protein
MKTNTYRKRHTGIPINKKQITVIKLACNLLGIADETYRGMLQDRYKVTSCTKLSYDQAGEFIRELEGKGFTLKPKKGTAKALPPRGQVRRPISRIGGNVIALVSQDERDKIAALADLIEWREVNGLALFLEKRMGIREGRVRTSGEAYLAIEGLKKMFENGMKAKHGKDWWVMPFESEEVREYIELHCPEEWR